MDNAPTITSMDDQTQSPPVVTLNATGEDTRAALPPGAAWNDDGSTTLTLMRQVQLTVRQSGVDTPAQYDALVFGPLRGKQLLGVMNKAGDDRTIGLIAASTGLSPLIARMVVEQMDARDLVRAIAIVGVFTDSGQTTGP